jgi:D-alanyl-D-alanine carboxypeptidase (penicillin-binding protein 5/6)
VWLGNKQTVPLVGGRDVVLTMPRGWKKNAKIEIAYASPVPAPISRGDMLGKLTVSGDGVPSMEMPLLAGADVDRLGLPGRAMAVLSRYVSGG